MQRGFLCRNLVMGQKPSKMAKNFFGFFERVAYAPVAPPGSATGEEVYGSRF